MHNISLGVNLRTIWLCKRISATEWDSPKKKRFNIVPADSEAEVEAFGASHISYYRIKCSSKESEMFSVGDRVYFQKNPPVEHNPTQGKQEDANYVVEVPPTSTIGIGTIYIKKLEKR